MTLKFHAKALHTARNDDHLMVGFADDPVATTEFVVLSRGISDIPDIPREISGGLYVEYGDEAMSGYGCVRAITLAADRITIKIDRTLCPQIPHAEFVITFDAKSPEAADLASLIEDIAGNDASFKQTGGRA